MTKPPEKEELGDAEKKRRQAVIEELREQWDRKLAVLNEPGAAEKIDAIMNACGKTKRRPKAGESY